MLEWVRFIEIRFVLFIKNIIIDYYFHFNKKSLCSYNIQSYEKQLLEVLILFYE